MHLVKWVALGLVATVVTAQANELLLERKARFPVLEERANKTGSSPEGQVFYQVFLKEVAFIRQCAELASQAATPATMYVEIKDDGRAGQIEFYPISETTNCVEKLIRNHVFPKPTGVFVARLFLSLTPVKGDIMITTWGYPFAVPSLKSSRHLPCEFIAHGTGGYIGNYVEAPKIADRNELIKYELYVCSNTDPQFFVLWWLRNHIKGGSQLVEEIVLPAKLFTHAKIVDERTGKSQYLLGLLDECRDQKKNKVNIIYTNVGANRPMKTRALFAWRVDLQNQTMIPVSLASLAECMDHT